MCSRFASARNPHAARQSRHNAARRQDPWESANRNVSLRVRRRPARWPCDASSSCRVPCAGHQAKRVAAAHTAGAHRRETPQSSPAVPRRIHPFGDRRVPARRSICCTFCCTSTLDVTSEALSNLSKRASELVVYLVAGAGFEPATFGSEPTASHPVWSAPGGVDPGREPFPHSVRGRSSPFRLLQCVRVVFALAPSAQSPTPARVPGGQCRVGCALARCGVDPPMPDL